MNNSLFEQIYKEHSSMVYNLGLSYVQNIEDAEEITQDVFIKVYEKYDSFNHQSSLKTWVYRITINKSLDFIKSKTRVKRFGFLSSIFAENNKDATGLINFNHPGVQLEDKEATIELFLQINSLPEKQKTALILKSIDGLSQKEVAEVMQVSEKSVESLLSRSRKKLKKKIKKNKGI